MLESVHIAMTENSKQKLSYILWAYISNNHSYFKKKGSECHNMMLG